MSFYSLAVVRRKQSKQTSLNLKKKPLLLAKRKLLFLKPLLLANTVRKEQTLKKLLRAAEGLRHRWSVRSYETFLISSQSFILIFISDSILSEVLQCLWYSKSFVSWNTQSFYKRQQSLIHFIWGNACFIKEVQCKQIHSLCNLMKKYSNKYMVMCASAQS